jgi:hypothetical protein
MTAQPAHQRRQPDDLDANLLGNLAGGLDPAAGPDIRTIRPGWARPPGRPEVHGGPAAGPAPRAR